MDTLTATPQTTNGTAERAEKETRRRCDSPVRGFPGYIILPDLDTFNGEQWEQWTKFQQDTPNMTYNRFMCYAGLKLIEAMGEWHIETPIATIAGWQDDKKAERVRFVSWIGKQVSQWHEALVDPKGSPV